MKTGEKVQMESERMLGEKQQWHVWINLLTGLKKGNLRAKGEVKLRMLLFFFVCLKKRKEIIKFSSKMQKHGKLSCSPGWRPLDRTVSQGLLSLRKCQIAHLSLTRQLDTNRDGRLNCSFYFLSKSLTIKTALCRDLRSLHFFF